MNPPADLGGLHSARVCFRSASSNVRPDGRKALPGLLQAGARPAFVGPLLLLCGASGLVGLWYVGSTLDRNPRRTILVIFIPMIVAILSIGATFPTLVAVLIAAALWAGAFGGIPSIYQACAVRSHATSPELAGAWVNATANFGIAGGAAIGAALLPVTGTGGLPWVSAGLVAFGLAVLIPAIKSPKIASPSRVTDVDLEDQIS
jgi:predicted MFS family arabinose efflux permease